jgi:ABC-2 type transport system ATP-binding protein
VAESVVGANRVSTMDGTLRLSTDAGRAAELTRALVLADIAVLEVRPQERTLEDAFFQMTSFQMAGPETASGKETTP